MVANVDSKETVKFNQLQNQWWDKNGPLKTLHDINNTRLEFIKSSVVLRGKRVLDLGCGGGILSESLAKEGAIVTGLDADHAVIDAAIKHSRFDLSKLNYQVGLIEEYQAEPFDAITCLEMLEHVPNPESVIKHCARLLKPQGLVFFSTLNRCFKAYVTSVLIAEYWLNLLPRQTHDFNKFIKPSELIAAMRNYHLGLKSMKGLKYNPFSRRSWLSQETAVNYMVCGYKV